MPRCLLGLGGNVGDVPAAFRSALQQLSASGVAVRKASRFYRTAPVGPHAGHAYDNACALVETALSPADLLRLIQRAEDTAGRSRATRWTQRTLDVDLLAYGDLIQDDADLTVPHPGLVYRRFVLDPLQEIAPHWRHPRLGRTLEDLQRRLLRRPLPILLFEGDERLRSFLRAQLLDRFPAQLQVEVDLAADVLDPTLILTGSRAPEGGGLIRETGAVLVPVDAQIAERDPLAATVAIVTAMLDEPQVVGDIPG